MVAKLYPWRRELFHSNTKTNSSTSICMKFTRRLDSIIGIQVDFEEEAFGTVNIDIETINPPVISIVHRLIIKFIFRRELSFRTKEKIISSSDDNFSERKSGKSLESH